MRVTAPIALLAVLLSSCHESERSISASGTRELTLFDQKYPGNIKDHPPLTWRRIPGTQMRNLNYLAGPNENVEIFMGNSGGDLLGNANRWLGQFGLPPADSLDTFPKITVLGTEALLIEASGEFNSGMGQPPQKDQALIGFIRKSGDEVLTLKMTGPIADVNELRQDFLDYSASLEVHAPQLLPEPTPGS